MHVHPVPIPVLFCFDVEPDEFFIDPTRRDPWTGFEATYAFVEGLRPRWQDATGTRACVSWFPRLDPQIARTYGAADWPLRHYAREFTRLDDQGDEIGVHPHAYRWNDGPGAWTLDYADQAWVNHCVESSCDTYARAMGRPCRAFRFGDRWMSQATVALLGRLGVAYDLTLEPGQAPEVLHHPGEHVTGTVPDLRHIPAYPYRPHHDDYRQPDLDPSRASGLWIIPLSSAHVRSRLLRRIYYRLRHPHRADVWTALLSHEPLVFDRIVADVLTRPHPYLAIVMRSNALAVPRLRARVMKNVETLFRHLRERAWTAVTPRDAIAWLTTAAGPTVAPQWELQAEKTRHA